MSKYEELREQFPLFIYDGYEMEETIDEIHVIYHFQIPDLASFAPEWRFPKNKNFSFSLGEDAVFQNMLFSLGMVELVSYWKICCVPRVEVRCGHLTEKQVRWWKRLYYYGLGEFFYKNRISEADPESFMELVAIKGKAEAFNSQPEASVQNLKYSDGYLSFLDSWPEPSGCLVPIGGGKDSAVSLELVKKTGERMMAFVINPRGATAKTATAAGLAEQQIVAASRTLDKNMLVLNQKGYLNGHTPFSALVAFSSVIAAYMNRLRYVVLSNESSANESTVPGSAVNHQYSKSFSFERDFHEYEKEYLKSGIYYFSLLRPLSEFQIARYFAGQKQYHHIFRSCNVGSKTDSWCGHCPKCLFVYLILSPFLPLSELTEIFGADMLNDESLRETLEQLVGIRQEKPFECVGSRPEVNFAIVLTIQRLEKEGKKLPKLLAYYRKTELYRQYAEEPCGYFTYYDKENLLPEPFAALVLQECCH